jgi:hypothetical protein
MYSCMKVILDILEKLSKPDVNALLHEFGFRLAVDDLLSNLSQILVNGVRILHFLPISKLNIDFFV